MKTVTVINGKKLTTLKNNSFALQRFFVDRGIVLNFYTTYYGRNKALIRVEKVEEFKNLVASEIKSEKVFNNDFMVFVF